MDVNISPKLHPKLTIPSCIFFSFTFWSQPFRYVNEKTTLHVWRNMSFGWVGPRWGFWVSQNPPPKILLITQKCIFGNSYLKSCQFLTILYINENLKLVIMTFLMVYQYWLGSIFHKLWMLVIDQWSRSYVISWYKGYRVWNFHYLLSIDFSCI